MEHSDGEQFVRQLFMKRYTVLIQKIMNTFELDENVKERLTKLVNIKYIDELLGLDA